MSALSFPQLRGVDFNSAVVEFSRLRQSEPVHSIAALPAPESCGCVADSEISTEVIEALPGYANIDDEAIESCGYLGWLSGVARSA